MAAGFVRSCHPTNDNPTHHLGCKHINTNKISPPVGCYHADPPMPFIINRVQTDLSTQFELKLITIDQIQIESMTRLNLILIIKISAALDHPGDSTEHVCRVAT